MGASSDSRDRKVDVVIICKSWILLFLLTALLTYFLNWDAGIGFKTLKNLEFESSISGQTNLEEEYHDLRVIYGDRITLFDGITKGALVVCAALVVLIALINVMSQRKSIGGNGYQMEETL